MAVRDSEAYREVLAQAVDYISALTTLTNDELDQVVDGALDKALRSFDEVENDEGFEKRRQNLGANLRAGLARTVIAMAHRVRYGETFSPTALDLRGEKPHRRQIPTTRGSNMELRARTTSLSMAAVDRTQSCKLVYERASWSDRLPSESTVRCDQSLVEARRPPAFSSRLI